MPPPKLTKGLDALSDQELVERCLRAGQHYDEAFEALYRRHSPAVFGFLVKITRNRAAAEDALQETFLRVYKALERIDTRRDLTAWMLQIARYVAIDAFRVEKKVKRLEERVSRERSELPKPGELGDPLEDAERREAVEAVLEELSPEDRSLLLFRHFHGLTFRAIGDAIDCSARTAQNRVEAAARRFQRALLTRRAPGGGNA